MMSRKTYEAVAAEFRKLHAAARRMPAWDDMESALIDAAYALSDIFEDDNPRFKPGRFLDACRREL